MVFLYFVVAFLISWIGLLFWKNYAKKIRMVGIDINKLKQPEIAESGGTVVLVALIASLVIYSVINGESQFNLIKFVALVAIVGLVGLWDDTTKKLSLGGKALSWKKRAIIMAIACLTWSFLTITSLSAIILTAAFLILILSLQNTFAGLNGWEVGSGLILSIVAAYLSLSTPYFPIAVILIGVVLGLFLWNAFPAKIFPGDCGTYVIGSSLAVLFILTKNELLGVFLFLPHLIDFFLLKMITNPNDASQKKQRPYKLLKDERLDLQESIKGKRRFDFAKLIIKIFGPLKEYQITIIILSIVIINSLFWLFMFGKI